MKHKTRLIDLSIITVILITIILIVFIFFNEFKKNNAIKISKKNFNFVKVQIELELNNCDFKNEDLIFTSSCENFPNINEIQNYFNNKIKLINAHNGKKGIDNEIPGSIILEKSGREISMSIDYDLDGSIDVNHKIIFKKNK
ncbi:MAG: hypothetical protein CFH19_00266 [Alphaproteobacteria bacterium MarineAlpha5_Bin9]|nr:MAG: hypothetical protein CFH19_00266 [Alphaproteobacteria bacterium MarineAlpha5_Bin9]|tara:strand:+ start:1421 stop:1846 length:426 start_codon:yes stop_codon:yes gene_type:complete